jgi:single-stranded DNA-binding protein
MPENNQVFLQGEVAARPYFDLVPRSKHDKADRIAFFKVLLDVPRTKTQALDAEHTHDRLRVVAYGKLAEALRGKIKPGDWMAVTGWIQVRRRDGTSEEGQTTIAELVAHEVKHFMRPFVPDSPLMLRLERIAEVQGVTVRDLASQILADHVKQVELELQLAGVNPG